VTADLLEQRHHLFARVLIESHPQAGSRS
jgi:hypothetical protein